jgi:hypothetical protein
VLVQCARLSGAFDGRQVSPCGGHETSPRATCSPPVRVRSRRDPKVFHEMSVQLALVIESDCVSRLATAVPALEQGARTLETQMREVRVRREAEFRSEAPNQALLRGVFTGAHELVERHGFTRSCVQDVSHARERASGRAIARHSSHGLREPRDARRDEPRCVVSLGLGPHGGLRRTNTSAPSGDCGAVTVRHGARYRHREVRAQRPKRSGAGD